MGLRGAVSAVSRPAAAVILAFAVLKIAILAYYGPLRANDTMGYQWVADAMAHDPRFWISVPDWTTDALPAFAFRPIGYPFLLVLTQSWSIAVLLQIAMSAAVAWQMTRIVFETTKSHRLATAAAVFYLAGQTLLWDASVLSDTFYTALFNLVMLTLMRAAYRRQKLSNGVALGLGFAWGYAIWIRENGLYLTILPLALLLFSSGIAYRRRLAICAVFLAPVVLMVGIYAGWNHLRTGETFIGITGTPNYLRPVFEIAKAGHVDPFADGSELSKTVKATATDFSYPEQVVILEKFQHETGLDPLAIQRVAQRKLIDTAVRWPGAYAAVTLQNLNPARLGPIMFDPLTALNDFYQLGIPPYQRIVPGTGLKSFKELAAGHRYGGLALAASSLIAQLLATGLFLYTIARIAIGAAGAAIARRPPSPELALALQALGAFLLVVASFALIHSEARHLMPVVPAFLIATAVSIPRPPLSSIRLFWSGWAAPRRPAEGIY